MTPMNFPQNEAHGVDLAAAALRLMICARELAGDTPHSDRQVFKDAIRLLQRQARRVALQTYDDCTLRLAIDCDKAVKQFPHR